MKTTGIIPEQAHSGLTTNTQAKEGSVAVAPDSLLSGTTVISDPSAGSLAVDTKRLNEASNTHRLSQLKDLPQSEISKFKAFKGKARAVCMRNDRPTIIAGFVCVVAGMGIIGATGGLAAIAGLGVAAGAAVAAATGAGLGIAGLGLGPGGGSLIKKFVNRGTKPIKKLIDQKPGVHESKLSYALRHGDTSYAKLRINELGNNNKGRKTYQQEVRDYNNALSDFQHVDLSHDKNTRNDTQTPSVLSHIVTFVAQHYDNNQKQLPSSEFLANMVERLEESGEESVAGIAKKLLEAAKKTEAITREIWSIPDTSRIDR